MTRPRCYLLCFDSTFGTPKVAPPGSVYVGARHYLGVCLDGDVARRFGEHTSGRGARLVAAVVQAGIPVRCVRTWPGGWTLEKRLKRYKKPVRLCPSCNPRLRRRMTRKWRLEWRP